MINLPDYLYSPIYTLVLCLLSISVCVYYSFSATNERIAKNIPATQVFAAFFTIIIILFIGLRPGGAAFGDMNYYAYVYNNIYDGVAGHYQQSGRGEWIFYEFGNFCKGSVTPNIF